MYTLRVTFQAEDMEQESSAKVVQVAPNLFDVSVKTAEGSVEFSSIAAQLLDLNTLSVTLDNEYSHITIVSQPLHAAVPALRSPNAMERLHIFTGGQKTTLVLPSPKWLFSPGGDLSSAKGTLKAPMPSLIVELRVKAGHRVEKGQAVVVIESMKTETVLRAHAAGLVKAVGCKTGEMVEEGRELVVIEADE
jgi:3-methylcrotonyl-CoA carboxylase alpha subunit